MGARVAAEVASNSSLTTDFVYGVACLSYPLHPPRKTSELRVSPLLHLGVPVLFISGRKDPFCRADLMENATLNRMANDWTMHWVDGADHELKVNGKVNNEIISNMCEWFVQWCQSVFMAERSWYLWVKNIPLTTRVLGGQECKDTSKDVCFVMSMESEMSFCRNYAEITISSREINGLIESQLL